MSSNELVDTSSVVPPPPTNPSAPPSTNPSAPPPPYEEFVTSPKETIEEPESTTGEDKAEEKWQVLSVTFPSDVALGISWNQNRVTKIETDSPAAQAGVQEGWSILQVNDNDVIVCNRNSIKNIIKKEKGKEIKMLFQQDNPHEDRAVMFPQYGNMSFARHLVNRDDNLYHLAAKYGTSISQIRLYNSSVCFNHLDNVHDDYIFIPIMRDDVSLRPDSEVQGKRTHYFLIKGFQERGCIENSPISKMEATYYLEEHNWDFEKAVTNWLEDIKWEKENPQEKSQKKPSQKKSNTPSPTASPTTKKSNFFLRQRNKSGKGPLLSDRGVELGSMSLNSSTSTTTTSNTVSSPL